MAATTVRAVLIAGVPTYLRRPRDWAFSLWLRAWPWSPAAPERRGATPFHSQHIAHRGSCGKTRVVPQNCQPRPEPAEMGVAKCACCCRRLGRVGMSNRWWDSRCSCGHSARGCGCARRRTRGSLNCWPVPACRWCRTARGWARWRDRQRRRTRPGAALLLRVLREGLTKGGQ